jgi:acylphosphatase
MIRIMSQNDIQEVHTRVRGVVQGVGFRDFVVQEAEALGLCGYTRNTESQDVLVVAQGPRPALERLLAQLQQGPSTAAVDDIQTTWHKPTEQFRGFTIRW